MKTKTKSDEALSTQEIKELNKEIHDLQDAMMPLIRLASGDDPLLAAAALGANAMFLLAGSSLPSADADERESFFTIMRQTLADYDEYFEDYLRGVGNKRRHDGGANIGAALLQRRRKTNE